MAKNLSSPTATFNAVNRGVYIADNLDFLRAINTASVDLVCIDPPFAKNDTFTADKLKPPIKQDELDNERRLLKDWDITTAEEADAAGIAWPDDPKSRGGYRDTWDWDTDVHPDWQTDLEHHHPALAKLIEVTREIHGDGIAAYLCFMAIRLVEIHRILKPTGSLYLHCNYTANGYLRQLLDGVFGREQFRNEVVWAYQRWTGATKTFQRMHDTIYFYAKSGEAVFHQLSEPYSNKSQHKGRRNSTFTAEGKIQQEYTGDTSRQKAMRDVWEISYLNSQAKERTGYPTQKPIALAERIIQASTNPGDIVLDCFAGCAYAALAAEKLGRKWIACDINLRAWTVFQRQFNKGGDLPKLTCNDQTTGQQVMGSEPTVTIHGPKELPKRTTPRTVEIKALRTNNRRAGGNVPEGKREKPLMTPREILKELLDFTDGKAYCCGFISKNADGSYAYGDYELDHIIPKSVGGPDEITNRQPLCSTHNNLKRDLDLDLKELRALVGERQEYKPGCNSRTLPRPDRIAEHARDVYIRYYRLRRGE